MPSLRKNVIADDLRGRLRSDTASAHGRLEAAVDLLGAAASRGRYIAFLRALAAVHPPIEARLQNFRTYREAVPDARERLRAHWLESDLEALGVSAPAPIPASLGDLSEALGAAYVFEGSTLGGRILSREIPAKLGVPSIATRYVDGYGDHTAARWRAFLDCLSRAEPQVDVERAVATARRVFDLLRVRFEYELQSAT